MILGIQLLTEIRLNLKFYDHVIKADGGLFIGATAHMVDLGKDAFKYLNTGKIKPEEIFTDVFVKEVYGK